MSSAMNRACEGGCGKTEYGRKKWTCGWCADEETSQLAEEYAASPIGDSLDDVANLEDMKQWLRDHWVSA